MTFPSNADADPDPTTQMPWPSSRRNASGSHNFKDYPGGAVESPQTERGPLRLDLTKFAGPGSKKRLTTKDLIFLSISMAGAQIAWTVELGCVVSFTHLYRFWLLLRLVNHRSAYGLCGQVWDAVFVEFGIVGTAHVVGVAGGPHQRVDCPATHRYVHLLQCIPRFIFAISFLVQWQNFSIPSHNQSLLPLPYSPTASVLIWAIFIHSNTFPLLYHNTTR